MLFKCTFWKHLFTWSNWAPDWLQILFTYLWSKSRNLKLECLKIWINLYAHFFLELSNKSNLIIEIDNIKIIFKILSAYTPVSGAQLNGNQRWNIPAVVPLHGVTNENGFQSLDSNGERTMQGERKIILTGAFRLIELNSHNYGKV